MKIITAMFIWVSLMGGFVYYIETMAKFIKYVIYKLTRKKINLTLNEINALHKSDDVSWAIKKILKKKKIVYKSATFYHNTGELYINEKMYISKL